jgi:hypothetical protein
MRRLMLATVLVTTAVLATTSIAVASAPDLRVVSVQRVVRQTVPTPPGQGNQSGVTLQAAVAADPSNSRVAVAATAEGRAVEQGGSAALGYAWTRSGGARWRSGVLRGVTRTTGGLWDATNWPSVAFGPQGTAYLAGEVRSGCASGIVLASSKPGGGSFAKARLVQHLESCERLIGKVWVGVDTGRHSPYRGRVWLAWTLFHFAPDGTSTGQQQMVASSDDRGRTWTPPQPATSPTSFTNGTELAIQPDGAVTLSFITFTETTVAVATTTSNDGGRSFGPVVTIRDLVTGGPPDIRCCFPSITADPRTGHLYVAFNDAFGAAVDATLVVRSSNGRTWSSPVVANRDHRPSYQHYTASVGAYGGKVVVSWTARATQPTPSPVVQQQVAVSRDAGHAFGAPRSLGPPGDITAAPLTEIGYFTADYVQTAVTAHLAYTTWVLPRRPVSATQLNQTLWAATLQL